MVEEITAGVELPFTTEPEEAVRDLIHTSLLVAMFAHTSISKSLQLLGVYPETGLYYFQQVELSRVKKMNTYLKYLAGVMRHAGIITGDVWISIGFTKWLWYGKKREDIEPYKNGKRAFKFPSVSVV